MQPVEARRLSVLSNHILDAHQGNPSSFLASKCKGSEEEPVDVASKVCTADEAVTLINDGHWLTVQGFVGTALPEALTLALRRRFDATGHPRGLSLLMVASVGDGKGRGMDVLAQKEGLLKRVMYGWAGNCPSFTALIRSNKIQAWNIPLGVASHMIRDVAAGRNGPITHVGLGTFVDPRQGGGKLNTCTTEDIVHLVSLPKPRRADDPVGKELLWYQAPPALHVALLRGTTADLDGNISFEKEALLGDALAQAMAARNSGGVVIVQVERLAARGSLATRDVHIPGTLVDRIVVAPQDLHWQTVGSGVYDPSLSGELRVPTHLIPVPKLDARRVIAHRATLEIDRAHMMVNLGVGMPEGVSSMVAVLGSTLPGAATVTLSTEAGAFGGFPSGGPRFGTAHNAMAHVPTNTMIDFYNGGGVDLACLGMAEVDEEGNVNVHKFGGAHGRMPGCGGFIDISQTAKKVCFMGTFTSGGLEIEIRDGRLAIVKEGRARKFKKRVLEKTFSAAAGPPRPILYITERAVFKLIRPESPEKADTCVELIEVSPGIDVQRDILDLMDFMPSVPVGGPKLMDLAIFQA